MSGGVNASDFQCRRYCVDLLAKEVFQKPVLVNKYDFSAGIKISRGVGFRDL